MYLQLVFTHFQFFFLLVLCGVSRTTYFIPSLISILFLSLITKGLKWERPILIFGSFLQLTYLISQVGGDELASPVISSAMIAASIHLCFFSILAVLKKSQVLLHSRLIQFLFQPWLIAFVFLIITFSINGLDSLYFPKLSWAIAYMLWPFLLGLNDLQKDKDNSITYTALFLCLCPPWYARLFHNVPTEHGPKDFSDQLLLKTKPNREYQSLAVKQLWFVTLLTVLNLFLNWILRGNTQLQIPFLQYSLPWTPANSWHLREFTEINYQKDTLEFLVAGFFQVISMFFQFIILSSTANSIALFMGFRFTNNERISYGLKMARSWSLLMHYLNHLVKTIFFHPAIRYLSFVKNRRHKNMLAAIFSIYSFGICYLAFIPYGGIFHNGHFTTRFVNRMFYLTLICTVAGFRIYGPKINPRTRIGKILHYLIPFLLIIIMSMGVLSLST